MLTLQRNLNLNLIYNRQRDFFLRGLPYSTAVVLILELARAQVPEVNLLQLIPGFYLILLLFFFFFFFFFSDLLIRSPLGLELRKKFGPKSLVRLSRIISFTFSFFFFSFITIINLNIILPISLDCFNSYGERTMENLWSFNEVLCLELILLNILAILSQTPTVVNIYLLTEKEVTFLPIYWKPLLIAILVISGFLTPTIDGYTQLNFSFASFFLYLSIIQLLEKRINIKFQGNTFFGF
jgi:hypothetical protein